MKVLACDVDWVLSGADPVCPGTLQNIQADQIPAGMTTEDATELAAWYARGLLFYPEPWTPEQYIERVEGVRAEAVHKIAASILKNGSMGVACVGPYTDKDFKKMLQKAFV